MRSKKGGDGVRRPMALSAVSLLATAVLSFTGGALTVTPFVRSAAGGPGDGRVFELRVYHVKPGRLADLSANFRDHNVRLLARHGIESIGYWTPVDEPGAGDTLVFLVAHASRDAAVRSWAAFREDPEWKALASKSQAAGPILERVESTYLKPTDYSPLQ